jgi:photosynthetic reaction center cytochrome c subunit
MNTHVDRSTFMNVTRLVVAALAGLVLAGCERPVPDSVQHGYRGTGMLQVYNPRTVADQIPGNQAPAALPAAPAEGPKARDIYQNVKVLGDLSIAQFTRQMTAITAWVAPQEGCTYCHNAQNFADESKYTKVVARKMLQMTQQINSQWKSHVAETGVTCYTCHRGNNIPKEVWFTAAPQKNGSNFIGDLAEQNQAAPSVGLASLPYDPFTPFLLNDMPIRVAGGTSLPTGNRQSIKQTEWTYSLMEHMSLSLGVNCTYCHNSRSFGDWSQSSPQRTTAYHGIRMAREINTAHMVPLTATFPTARKGPTGDVAKVSCATCHQGAYKPLYGAKMAKDYPELQSAAPAVAPLPAPLAEAMRAVMYFGVGDAVLQGPQEKGMAQLIVSMTEKAALKATISGYHSASGTLDANQALAKQRAFTVRDALLAAGVAESRVVLAKPQQMQANGAGEDHDSRRVEVTLK